jgi:hypothetical protein
MHLISQDAAEQTKQFLFLRLKHFLNANLVDEVLATQVYQVGYLFVVGQIFPDAYCHRHHEGVVSHVQPIRAADKFVVSASHEWVYQNC